MARESTLLAVRTGDGAPITLVAPRTGERTGDAAPIERSLARESIPVALRTGGGVLILLRADIVNIAYVVIILETYEPIDEPLMLPYVAYSLYMNNQNPPAPWGIEGV